jgi:hypothetical protein
MDAFDHDPEQGGLALGRDWLQTVAAAADLCLQPRRHGVIVIEPDPPNPEEINVRLEARSPDGSREPNHDLELEIYRSGADLNVMLSWCTPPDRPLLWHGRHPVWMDGANGEPCARPADGSPLEALARRIRALLLS